MTSGASHKHDNCLSTILTDLFGIQYPIVLAGMSGGITTPQLVAAVSNAGGLGTLGANKLSPEQIREQIRAIKSMTDKPFAVNLIIAPPENSNPGSEQEVQKVLDGVRQEIQISSDHGSNSVRLPPSRLSEQLGIIFEEKVPVLSFGLGDPSKFVAEAHEHGTKVTAMVTTVEEAITVANGGVDAVVAQGAEAGGHRSTFKIPKEGEVPLVGTLALIPQVADALKETSASIPVIAAGGIGDGRGIAACMCLGAAGVQLGTRFLVASESGAFAQYKERLLNSKETDTTITRAFTGRPARSVRNRFINEFEKSKTRPLPWPLQAVAADDIYSAALMKDDAEYYPILAGQALRLLKRGQSASEIVRELVEEAKRSIVTLSGML